MAKISHYTNILFSRHPFGKISGVTLEKNGTGAKRLNGFPSRPFVVSLSNHERHYDDNHSPSSPPSTWLRAGFDKLRVNGWRGQKSVKWLDLRRKVPANCSTPENE
jgi:hypothetical protein